MPSFVGSVNRVFSPAPSSGSAFVYRGSDSSTPFNMSFPQPSTDPPPAHQKEEVFVSPMPSLDAKPDDGWANWGTDPSKIKKEEEQVKRPPAKTMSTKGSAISPVTHSAVRLDLNVRAENQKNSYTPPASVAYGHRTPGTLPPAPHSAGWGDPPAVAVRLPGPVQRQPYQASSGLGQSANFRPALPAASYTFRPTFQYGKAADDTAVSTFPTTPVTNLNTADSLIFRPPQLASRPSGPSAVQSQSTDSHEGMVTSLPRSRKPEASSDIKQSPLFAKAMRQLDHSPASTLSAVLPVAADTDMTTVSSTSTTANAAAPKKPKRRSKRNSVSTIPIEIKESLELSASHTEPAKSSIGSIHVASSNSKETADGGIMLWKSHKPLSDSIGADSGHALSSGPPSTVHASTAPSDGPKVHLPMSLPAESLPGTEKLDDIAQDFFTLPIPKGMTPTKAVLAIDLDALKELGANQVDVQVNLDEKQFAFKLNDSTKQAREKCALIVNLAFSALQEVCTTSVYSVNDKGTRSLLNLKHASPDLPANGAVEETPAPAVTEQEALECMSSLVAAMEQREGSGWELTKAAHESEPKAIDQAVDTKKKAPTWAETPCNDDLPAAPPSFAASPPRQSNAESVLLSLLRSSPTRAAPTSPRDTSSDRPAGDESISKNDPPIKDIIVLDEHSLSATRERSGLECDASLTPSRIPCEDTSDGRTSLRRSLRYPELFEIFLHVPQSIYDRFARAGRLMSHIRVEKWYYSLKLQRLYFMDSTEENAILGKTIFVVLLRLVHRGFGSQDPRMRLPFGSPGARLLEEMLTDQHHPMKYAKLDRLTAYVAARLYSESQEHPPDLSGGSSTSPRDDREDYTRQARDVISSVNAQPSPGKFEPDSRQSQQPTFDTTEEASQAASVPSQNDSGSAKIVMHTGGKEGAQAFQDPAPQGTTPGEQTNFANLSLEDLQVVLQQESSICWLVPACPVRKRFVGPGASYLKAIRDIARVPVIFWKNVGQSEDWSLFIIASHARLATTKERQNLAHTFRLCKAWAIAVNAEDCFPVARDIPDLYRDDADFRLNEFELSAALDKAARLKSTVQGQDFLRLALGVLHELGREVDRSHNDVSCPSGLQSRNNWRACHVGELCTIKNSICWTGTNNREFHTLIGERSCHLFTIERITGIKALKVDINKFRYGTYGCGIHILAYKPLAYSPSDKTRLSHAFRLMVFIMKVFGYDTLVPKQDSLIVDESYVTELFDACQLDEKHLPSIAPVLHGKGLSERLIRAVFSQLFAADGTVGESDSQLWQPVASTSCGQGSGDTPMMTHSIGSSVMDEVPSCDDMKIQTTGSSYDEAIDAFVGFGNIRDIPDFSLSKTGKIDDGYLPQDEEAALYEDVLSAWPRLRPREQMALIGSATWATLLVKELLSDLDMTKSPEDNGSIGPSASQVGAASEDTPSSRGMQETSTFADNAAWKTAYNEVTLEQDVAPRCADWANQVAKEACTEETGRMEGHLMSVGHPTEVNNNVQATIPAQVVASDDDHTLTKPVICLAIPNDAKVRKQILGEKNQLLASAARNSGAIVQLSPIHINQFDNERTIWIGGKDDCVARATQFIHNAVRTHMPSWRFSPDIEDMVQKLNKTAQAAEIARLDADDQGHGRRWTVNHHIFVPEAAIPLVEKASTRGDFVNNCAIIKFHGVIKGKATIEAPTPTQSDVALIQVYDLIRQVAPDWMPCEDASRDVILTADRPGGCNKIKPSRHPAATSGADDTTSHTAPRPS